LPHVRFWLVLKGCLVQVLFIQEAAKMLRKVGAKLPNAHVSADLWRGLKGRTVPVPPLALFFALSPTRS